MSIRLQICGLNLIFVMTHAVAETTQHELTEPTASPMPSRPPNYPAAIQRMVETGAAVEGQGIIGDLAFWVVQSNATRAVFLTSPDGLLIRGKVYRPDGSLKFDSEAEQPLIAKRSLSTAQSTPQRPNSSLNTREQRNAALQAALAQVRGPNGPAAVWADLAQATVIEEGAENAPLVYSFIDPYCPFCHQQWQVLREKIKAGQLRVRWVPVAVLERTKRSLGQVIGLLDTETTAADLQRWMTENKAMPSDTAAAKLNLVKNAGLFSRTGSKQVPTLLYQVETGEVVMKTGLTEL